MQKILLPLLLLLFSVKIFAQEHPEVEARLKLMENINSEGKREIAVALSIINHSDKAIYIPGLAPMSLLKLGLYEVTDTFCIAVNRFPDVYSSAQIVNGVGVLANRAPPRWSELYTKFHDNCARKCDYQDSLINSLPLKENLTDPDNNKPLLLQPKEVWEDYLIDDIYYLILSKKACYKLCFEPKHFDRSKFPKTIGPYNVFFQEGIKSNTIYYSNLSPEKQSY